MGHTFSNLLVHLVFSTKGRMNLLYKDIQAPLYAYICGIAKAEGCQIKKIGSIEDHILILAVLKPSASSSDFARTIKANSSKWIHENHANMKDFSWQSGFAIVSVSESSKGAVMDYISNQEKHHHRVSFADELKIFLEKHGIDYSPEHYLD